MASFVTEVPDLLATGPVIELQVGVGAAAEEIFRKSPTSLPTPVPALAMVDTGATRSVIQKGMAAKLGLNPVGTVRITTPSSTNVVCYTYRVRLFLPNRITVETSAIEAPLQGQLVQCLIGRDVLANTVLVYFGYRNLFSLSM